jgi:hypothetical protein
LRPVRQLLVRELVDVVLGEQQTFWYAYAISGGSSLATLRIPSSIIARGIGWGESAFGSKRLDHQALVGAKFPSERAQLYPQDFVDPAAVFKLQSPTFSDTKQSHKDNVVVTASTNRRFGHVLLLKTAASHNEDLKTQDVIARADFAPSARAVHF